MKKLLLIVLGLSLIFSCCPDNDINEDDKVLVSHFNTSDNLLTVDNVRYFNAICDREVISNSGICVYVKDQNKILIDSSEYLIIDLDNLYPPGDFEIIDNQVNIEFVTDISSRVVYFDLTVIDD